MNKKYILAVITLVMLTTSCSNKHSINFNETSSTVSSESSTSSPQTNIDTIKDDNDIKSGTIQLIPYEKEIGKYKYVYVPALKISYNDNSLLNTIVEDKWERNSPNKILEKPDSYFNRYDIYFDQGIAISHSEVLDEEGGISISGRIFNIVYNNKYTGSIIEGITMSSSKSDAINLLGKPHFKDNENKVLGYKTEKFYIFFVGEDKFDEVSIYRRDTDYDKDTIRKIIEKYKKQDNEENLVSEVAEDIDADWSTYDYKYDYGYKYSERKGKIARGFLSQGVKLHYDHYCSSDDEPFKAFITIGSNFEGNLTEDISFPDKVEGLINFNSDIIKLELDKDYIFDSELQRIRHKKDLNYRVEKKGVISPDKTMVVLRNDDDSVDPYLSGGYLIYLNKNKPNVEFKAVFFNPNDFTWLSNRYIAYDVFKKGLFVYDINKNESICINGDFTAYLISAENGVITFTHIEDNEDTIDTMKYRFDKEGNIIIGDS